MDWVVRHLKSLLRREKMIGTRHGKISGDPKYAASAGFAETRVPQLTRAIEILEMHNKPKRIKVDRKRINPRQLDMFN